MQTVVNADDNLAMLVFDLNIELDRKLYAAYLKQLRPRLHPSDVPGLDQCLAQVEKIEASFPGYQVFTQ